MIVGSHVSKWRQKSGIADSGATHFEWSLESSLQYINSCYDDYVTYGGLKPEDIEGAEILEGGHGDNVGAGLRFLAAGAKRYTGVDYFQPKRDNEQQRRIYAALREQLTAAERVRFDRAVDLSGGALRFDENRVKLVHGHGLTELDRLFPRHSFDLLITRAVLQELDDLEGSFRAMDAVLKPGGRMMHKIDLGDYGKFTARGLHPLTMFTIPEWLYGMLARGSGAQLNRRTVAGYRALVADVGHAAKFFTTSVIRMGYPAREVRPHPEQPRWGVDYGEVERGLVEEIRGRLREPFRGLAEEDLVMSGVFLVSVKP